MIEIGLPFFTSIDYQGRNKPYFTAFLADIICPTDRLPAFQFPVSIDDATITDFDLINIDTGTTVDYLSHFLTNVVVETLDITKIYTYKSDFPVTLEAGRYYLYAKTTNGYEKWSEVFLVTDLTTSKPIASRILIETGLPFFDNINKQVSKQTYFKAYFSDWLSASNRLPPFQFMDSSGAGMITFSLINSDTLVETDLLSYFSSNVVLTTIDLSNSIYNWSHLGVADVSISNGRYYFYAKSISGYEYWSEEFVVCGNVEESNDYLLISNSDYLLIGATDKLKIG
jgi:hypothetical protein